MFRFLAMLLGVVSIATAAPITLELNGGSVIQGELLSWDRKDAKVKAEFGILPFKREQISEKSLKSLALASGDVSALLAKITELEAKVNSLQRENAILQSQLTTGPSAAPASVQVVPANSLTAQATPAPVSRGSYTISSAGTRHNYHCRYYGVGRSCGPTDGIACKICDG